MTWPSGEVSIAYDCEDFSTRVEAQQFFLANGGPYRDPYNLDGDGYGIVCEWGVGGYSSASKETYDASLASSARDYSDEYASSFASAYEYDAGYEREERIRKRNQEQFDTLLQIAFVGIVLFSGYGLVMLGYDKVKAIYKGHDQNE